jgi:tRNA uridine 5-carboxymethylaminomethyl modification enzyme
MQKTEHLPLPPDFDYHDIDQLRFEAREKLNKFQPLNLGQASRISGINPADVTVLMVFLEQRRRQA